MAERFAFRRTLRFRTAATAVAVLAVGLLLAAIAFDVVLGIQLRRAFDRELETQATDRALLIGNGADLTSVLNALGDEEFVVVLGADGSVVDSVGIVEPAAVVGIEPDRAVDLVVTVVETSAGVDETETEPLRVYAAPIDGGGLVVVGAEDENALAARTAARPYLIASEIGLLVVAAAVAWRSVGQALRPVERLRSEVDAIAGTGTGERVTAEDNGDELEALAATMNDLLDRVDAQAIAQRRFVADASHELKSPVANIQATIETAAPPADTTEWDSLQTTLLGETDRLRSLIDDLLFLARTDEAGITPKRDRVALDDVVFDELERCARTHPGIRFDAGGVQPVVVDGDRMQLVRVVRNLVENAARHADSSVRVAAAETDGGVVITIDDDGPGIPADERERVFERFVRLDESRTRGVGGSGLGLPIVAAIVEAHGGSVRLSDSAPQGLRVEVLLPRDH